MATLDLKKVVLNYIDNADERLLKLLKAVAESYQNDSQEDFTLSQKQYQMLDLRRKAHLNEESESYTWKQVKQNARKAAQDEI
jgi:arginine utilization protein RocB